MEKRALIGITVYKNEAGREPEHSYYLNEAYSSMVSRAGGLPVLLPYTFDGWDLLDGVLIAGGPDLTEEVAHDAGEPGELSPACWPRGMHSSLRCSGKRTRGGCPSLVFAGDASLSTARAAVPLCGTLRPQAFRRSTA